ncbi:MAG: PaaI family thioesterase [Acidobacteria bacterium]|nr:PaaI family thioesterase [Acidobacteriota bacterium]
MRKKKVRPRHLDRIRQTFHRVEIVRQLGMKLERLRAGQATLLLDIREEHLHPQGAVHGGVIATLVDTALGMALFTLVPPQTRMATIEMSVNYLAAHRSGRLRAEARVLRLGRRIAVGEVDVWNRRRERVAKSLLTYAIRRKRER